MKKYASSIVHVLYQMFAYVRYHKSFPCSICFLTHTVYSTCLWMHHWECFFPIPDQLFPVGKVRKKCILNSEHISIYTHCMSSKLIVWTNKKHLRCNLIFFQNISNEYLPLFVYMTLEIKMIWKLMHWYSWYVKGQEISVFQAVITEYRVRVLLFLLHSVKYVRVHLLHISKLIIEVL